MDDGLKSVIKKNYKVIDKSSEEYYELFWGNVSPHLKSFVECDETTQDESILGVQIVKDITVGDALTALKDTDKDAFWNYLNILIVFAYLYNEAKTSKNDASFQADVAEASAEVKSDTQHNDNDEDTEASDKESAEVDDTSSDGIYLLFVKYVKILGMVQRGEDASLELEDILDDDVKKLASKIKTFAPNNDVKIDEAADTMPMPPMEFLESIENSKIANLAKEISKEINISSLNIDKPEDIAKLMDFSGSNNLLGNIVNKVSSKLTEKISAGEINQEDLMSEAMSMMSMLNGGGLGGAGGLADMLKGMGGMGGLGDLMNNPMMSEMMKMAKKGKTQTKNTGGQRKGTSSTRDRLRKKLDEKKKQTDSSS